MLNQHNSKINEANVPAPSNIPQPNPGGPSPKIPNPEPIPNPPTNTGTDDGSTKNYKCKICGKIFTSKEELDFHIETVHKSPKKI